jgi:hypothetical protein
MNLKKNEEDIGNKEGALGRTVWRTGFGVRCGAFVRLRNELMNERMNEWMNDVLGSKAPRYMRWPFLQSV